LCHKGVTQCFLISEFGSIDLVRMDLWNDPKAESVVKTFVAQGKTLDLTVTAEGEETRAQADALIALGCDRVQGYLYGRPLPATAPIF
jgi:EAL domain-containing protein (putative c-di-GMP-specific phosphodiesterase class I)